MRSTGERNAAQEREDRVHLVVERAGRIRRLALGIGVLALVLFGVLVLALGALH